MNEQDSGGSMQPDEGSAVPPAQQTASAGARLAAAREARGWGIDDVAAQLNLAPRQVAAIEADNYAALPGTSVTRGFIRAYAKLVHLDPAPLLAGLGNTNSPQGQATAPRPITETPFAASRLPTLGQRKRSFVPAVAVAAVILLGAGGYWLLQQRGLVPALPGSGVTQTEQQDIPAAGGMPPAAEEPVTTETLTPPAAVPADPAGTETQPPQAPLPEALPGTSSSNDAALPGQQEAASQGANASVAQQGAAPMPEELRLSAREESWVEIKRVNGNAVVYARLMKPGESHAVPVTEPLALVVGNAAGVDLTLRGSALALKAGNGNVSRITVK